MSAAIRDDVFRAVADPVRRAILDRLCTGGLPVNAIASSFDMSRPAVSKHLRVLRESDLVMERREGRERIYELRPERLQEIERWVESYRKFWQMNLANLKRHVESQE